jgi:phosphoribosylaminoimidazole (AIR) synthetase
MILLYYYRALVKTATFLSKPSPAGTVTYADSGVDIQRGDQFVDMIKPLARSTLRIGADVDLVGFAGLFDLRPLNYKDPLLVCCTDGVGTKLKIAQVCGNHKTIGTSILSYDEKRNIFFFFISNQQNIGVDLVAMCVNDLVVQGAEPLVFLDYYASGKLDLNIGKQVLEGIAEGCRQANCSLIGGETAEMPGMYSGGKQTLYIVITTIKTLNPISCYNLGDYDVAGFSVGLVERHEVLPKKDALSVGDVVLGLISSGIHSNGFSLVRHLMDRHHLDYHGPCPFDVHQRTLGEALLTPTRIYVRSCLPLCRQGFVKAMAHITGGGLPENIPRVLPNHLAVRLDASQWTLPSVFRWLRHLGNLSIDELLHTFNCGIGMILVVAPQYVSIVHDTLQLNGEHVFSIGEVISRSSTPNHDSIVVDHTDEW